MSPRVLFACYVALSVVDFVATVFLVSHGYADEANPLIRGFAGLFSSFPVALALYKLGFLSAVTMLLRTVNRYSPQSTKCLLVFADTVMLCLGAWHAVCLRIALA